MALIRKLTILIAILIFSHVHAKGIYVIKHNNVDVAYLVGSTHKESVVGWSKEYLDTLNVVINRSSVLYMETAITPADHEIIKYFKNKYPWLSEMVDYYNLICMSKLLESTKAAMKTRSNQFDELVNSGALLYMLGYTEPVFLQKKNASKYGQKGDKRAIDEIVRNGILFQNKKVYEYEGYFKSTRYLDGLNSSAISKSIEDNCKLRKSRNDNVVYIDFELISNAVEYGAVNELRESAMFAYRNSGWQSAVIEGYFSHRDLDNAKTIKKVIDSNNGVLFLSGLLHLGGQDGLIANLNKLGYVVLEFVP